MSARRAEQPQEAMGSEGNEMETVRKWLKKLSSANHRRDDRRVSPMLVAYYWDGSIPVGHEVRNISSTGFYVVTAERWLPGTVITMTLQRTDIPDANSNPEGYICVLSKVIRVDKDGVGLIFLPVAEKDGANGRTRGAISKKAINRFLGNLKSEKGLAIVANTAEDQKVTVIGPSNKSVTPGGDVMKKLRGESGQALVVVALSMSCLIGFAALAADVGVMLRERRLVQSAADSAAIAGALELNYNNGNVTSAAKAAAAENGFTDGSGGATVAVSNPPSLGAHAAGANNASYVEVIITQNQPTFLMKVFGRGSMNVSSRAVAFTGGSSYCCACILSPNASNALDLQGSFTLNTPNCGITVNSNSSSALNFTGKAGYLYAGSIGVVGQVSGSPKNTISPVTGIVPMSDPFAGKTQGTLPDTSKLSCSAPTASSSSAGSGGGKKSSPTLSGNVVGPTTPGGIVCYSGTVNVNNANFPAGTYVFTGGDVNVSGTFTSAQPSAGNLGNGATFDIDTGTFSVATGTTFGIYAPESGSYAGVVLMQPSTNTNTMTIQSGNAYGTIDGIIYAPGAQLYLNDSGGDGSGGITLITDLIVGTLEDKTAVLSIQSYSQTNPGITPLTTVKLVE